MVKHSVDFKAAVHLETANYSSGNGTTVGSPTELLVTDLTAMDKIFSISLPIPKPERVTQFVVNSGLMPAEIVGHKIRMGQGSIDGLFQTTQFLTMSTSGTIGQVPNSFDVRYDDSDGQKELYGCLITEHTITTNVDLPVSQRVSIISAQGKWTGLTDVTIPDFSSGSVVKYSDVSATIDGISESTLHILDHTLTIRNEIDETLAYRLNSKYAIHPALIGREITFEMRCLETGGSTWFADEVNETTQYLTISIVYGSVCTVTLANMYVVETSQSREIKRGVIERKYKFKMGPNGSVTIT